MITHITQAASLAAAFSPSEIATIKVLPFLGIIVVIAGLSVLALILTQFKRLGGDDEKGHGHGHTPKKQPEKKKEEKSLIPAQTAAEATAAMQPGEDDEMAAVSVALWLYLQESGETVTLTEVERQYNTSPWTLSGVLMQQDRFQRWHSSKK